MKEAKLFFSITLCRTARRFRTVQIQANDLAEAEALALERSGDYSFPLEKSADITIEGNDDGSNHEPTSIYLALFHGRKKNEKLEDWGTDGPVIGPVSIQWTYGGIRLCLPSGEDEVDLPVSEGLVKIGEQYYGDFNVWNLSETSLKTMLESEKREHWTFHQFKTMITKT